MYIQLLVICLTFTLINAEKPIVETTHGKVQGKVLKSLLNNVEYYGFIGIPYAVPPLKELRFLPPKPAEPWDDVLVATKEKKACVQFNTNIRKGQPIGWYGDENCLYLDIFTPKLDDEMRPVIVFLYNTHFTGSYNKTKDYLPDFFIEENVVTVTLSHRLSVLGFLSLEDELVPGNAGLKDIVAALEWTKDNIVKFGGNPDKITLMGSQGGAVAVDLLLHSNAKHLFHSAILQGGSSLATSYLQEDLKERAFSLAELLDRPSSSNIKLLNDLTELPASDLVGKELHANPADYFKEHQRGVLTFGPIVEKTPNGLLTQYPEDSHERINIPIMIGFNSREGLEASLQYLSEPRYLSFVQKDFPFLIPLRIKFKFDPLNELYYKAVDDIKEFYFKNGRVTIKSVAEYITYIGDVITGYVVDQTVKMYAKRTESPLYYYHFDYISDLNEIKNDLMNYVTTEYGTWGAAGGDELCYLFHCPALKQLYLKHNKSMSEEIIIQRKLVKMWTNFAKYGDPTPEHDADLGLRWPTYDLENRKYLNIDKEITVKSDLNKERFRFWDNFIEKWEQRAINGIISSKNKDEL
ncbi:acetylcholinesterase-like [Ostrinia nubilalis]|uniref:acetylcholinesterase-like n=1 Tax=Ostrinia nubilalis TaxID=29057 RepID=UPI00308226DF